MPTTKCCPSSPFVIRQIIQGQNNSEPVEDSIELRNDDTEELRNDGTNELRN